MDDKLYASAIRMLAGREHSGYELKQKLQRKSYPEVEIDEVISRLITDKYLNDERFTEVFVNSKIKHGLGPVRIQLELQQRSVDESLIDAYLDFNQVEWFERAREVRSKRFGENLPMEMNEKAKQIRFLQQRGFMQQHIMNVISSNDFDD